MLGFSKSRTFFIRLVGNEYTTQQSGAALALCYVATSLVYVIVSLGAFGDQKGNFVLLQLPIALLAALLEAIGLGEFWALLGWGGVHCDVCAN